MGYKRISDIMKEKGYRRVRTKSILKQIYFLNLK